MTDTSCIKLINKLQIVTFLLIHSSILRDSHVFIDRLMEYDVAVVGSNFAC